MLSKNRNIIILIGFVSVFWSNYSQTKPDANTVIDSLSVINIKKNEVNLDTVKKNNVITDIIDHKADDYIIEDVVNKKIKLYNNAEVDYQDTYIKAGYIEIDYQNKLIVAKGILDSVQKYSQLPLFKTKGDESTQDSIIYNYKSKKALIYGLQTEQSGIFTLGEQTKKVNDSTIFVRGIRFTTDDKKNPDYYLATKKAKIVPNKKIVVGTTNLVIADVPTPLFLPFAYLPLSKKKTSGFIVPSYGESNNQGFFLQNGGYYFAGNDYFDLSVLGDVYSNGSWGMNFQSNYRKRYKFSGGLNLRFENLIFGVKGFSDYSKRTNFNFRWNHSQDSKSNPNSRLSASVNLGSSSYYRESLNQLNNAQALSNTLSSSVSYYKKFVGTPFNLSVAASHTQNTNTNTINMSLPSLQLNMERIYPFAPKNGPQKNPLQKAGLNYSMKADNRMTANDDTFLSPQMFKNAKNGIIHNASMNTNLKLLKYFTLSPSINYKEVWYLKSIEKRYDEETGEVVKDTLNGFTSFREFNTGASISTNIYGMFKFKGSKLRAIRHTIRPSISYNYRPDFSFYYKNYQRSEDTDDIGTYSPFEDGIYGSPSRNLSNSIGISVVNSFDAKIMPKDGSDESDLKKIKLINNLNLNTSYNIAADSLRWSPISLSTGVQLFKNKLSINMGASLDPYAIDDNGNRYDTFNINNGGSLFRLTRANMTMSYSISSKDFSKDSKQDSQENDNTPLNKQNNDMFGDNMTVNNVNPFPEDDESNQNETNQENDELYTASIPWSLRFSYSNSYNNNRGQKEMGNQSLMFTGDLNLTPRWKIGFSSGYDFKNNGFSYTQIRFSRDLDSWRLNFNWVPFGYRTSYYFFIGVKSSMLSDLKWDKRQLPDRRLF